jgi:hypothetical protein
MDTSAQSNVKQMDISIVIVRADGTIEDLGQVQYWHKNPIKRITWRIKKWLQSSLMRAKRLLLAV